MYTDKNPSKYILQITIKSDETVMVKETHTEIIGRSLTYEPPEYNIFFTIMYDTDKSPELWCNKFKRQYSLS